MKSVFMAIIGLVLSCAPLSANHFHGAEITYRYIGDSTNINHHYEVTMYVYLKLQGTASFPTPVICYQSSCFNSGSFQLFSRHYYGPNSTPNGTKRIVSTNPCADTTGFGNRYFRHTYKGDVILPGKCVDWQFNWQGCCRNATADNLLNGPSEGIVIDAHLNNMLGPNSSPVFTELTENTFCVGQSVFWNHSVTEPDGDSLHYYLADPHVVSIPVVMDCNLNSFSTSTYNSGFSAQTPISSSTPVTLATNVGFMTFTPNQIESDLVKLVVEEHKWDSTYGWVFAGRVMREVQIFVTGNCNANSQSLGITSIDGGDTARVDCFDTIVKFKTDIPYLSASLEKGGTDFAIYSSNGHLVPVLSADARGTPLSDSISLKIFGRFNANDTLHIVSRIGNDGNTLINHCGGVLNAGDSLMTIALGCSTSIGLGESQFSRTLIYPNPVVDFLFIQTDFKRSGTINGVITNSNGKEVETISIPEGNDHYQVQMYHLPSGLYILRLSTENKQDRYFKFVKK